LKPPSSSLLVSLSLSLSLCADKPVLIAVITGETDPDPLNGCGYKF
jgi:hypothetical protein